MRTRRWGSDSRPAGLAVVNCSLRASRELITNAPCHRDEDCSGNDGDDDEDPRVALVPRRQGCGRDGDALEDGEATVRALRHLISLHSRQQD